MDLHEVVSRLIADSAGIPGAHGVDGEAISSLAAFMPELVICATILAMLAARLFKSLARIDSGLIAFAGAGYAFYLAACHSPEAHSRMELFTGLLVYDTFTVFMRGVLLLFAMLFVVFTVLSGFPKREDRTDVYCLMLGATLGMCLMASANHLFMMFLAVEMASVPSYALAAMMREERRSSEAALKYSIYGAGAAGVMLYGISLVAGVTNSAHFPTIAHQLSVMELNNEALMLLALGGLMIMVGLAFKLSAVPFHFWCPDVFEGATAEIGAFLSVASKAAAIALLIRAAVGLSFEFPHEVAAGHASREVETPVVDDTIVLASHRVSPMSESEPALRFVSDAPAAEPAHPVAHADRANLIRGFIAKLIALLAIVTCTFGNLAAYGQTNIKRLFAYSTIAHAGYMMMAVPVIIGVGGVDRQIAERAVSAVAVYLAVYLFMNLGAFAVVAFLRNAIGSEEIKDYSGLLRRCPVVVVCLAMILFGLVGLPPLSGFLGKFAIFAALAEGYRATSQNYLILLLVVGGVNTALSLFYYLRVVKVMTIDAEIDPDRGPVTLGLVSWQGLFVVLLTLPTAVLIIWWDKLNTLTEIASRQLLGS